MQVANAVNQYYDRAINQLEQWFWADQQEIDQDSHIFYVFKPKPTALKRDELLSWVELQLEVCAPFKSCYHYSHVSDHGVHIWYASTPLNGTPETACTSAQADGDHLFSSSHFSYQQKWRNGVMISNLVQDATSNASFLPLPVNTHNAWALERKAEKTIKTPWFWYKVSAAIFILLLVWQIVGFATIGIQSQWLNHRNQQLNEAVGPKLQLQEEYAEYSARINVVDSWHRAFGKLPIKFSKVLATMLKIGDARINVIQWQGDKLAVEFVTSSLDITQLIEAMQKVEGVISANIKPHNAEETWVLEVQWQTI